MNTAKIGFDTHQTLSMTGNDTPSTSLPQIFIIATATTPDLPPLNRCFALYKIQDASATRTHHPKIRFMARRRIADGFGFGHAHSASLRSALTSPRLATTAHQSLIRYGLRVSSGRHGDRLRKLRLTPPFSPFTA